MRIRLPVVVLLVLTVAAACSHPVDPAFTFTALQLGKLVAGLPPADRAAVLAEPGAFLRLAAGALDAPAGALVLADKNHALPDGWEPTDLVPLDPAAVHLARGSLELRSVAVADLVEMSRAARADGVELAVSSTWRSYGYQLTLWQHSTEAIGATQTARELAEPGHSQHQLGTAVDFGTIDASFADTPASAWLRVNAWRYGWTLSYPEGAEPETGYRWEPWHYRWLGRSAAELVHAYFGGSQQRFLEFWNAAAPALAAARVRKG